MSRTLRVTLNDLYLVGLFQGLREADADITATRDDYAANGVFVPPHFTHEDPDVFTVRDKENLVAFLNDGIAFWQHRFAIAVNRSNSRLGVRNMLFECCDPLTYEQTVTIRPGAHESNAAIGEIEYLRGARIQN